MRCSNEDCRDAVAALRGLLDYAKAMREEERDIIRILGGAPGKTTPADIMVAEIVLARIDNDSDEEG